MIDALLHKEHTSYREIGHRAVAYTLERAEIPYTMDEVRSLVAQIERLTPFPDVPEALARLKTRYKIVVLSNGDPDMLEAAKVPQNSVRRGHLGRRRGLVQASRGDVHEGGGDRRRADGRSPVHRQPRVRPHRGQGGGHADSIHRSSPPALRRHPASARSRRTGHEEPRRHDGVSDGRLVPDVPGGFRSW